ncbi:hypothetical protein ABE530_05040 [Brucella sp. TWI559]
MSNSSYETTWLPAEWMDECIPATLRHPTDFIHKGEDGSFIVTPKNGKDDHTPEVGTEEQERLLIKLSIGDIVHFRPNEQYGTFPLWISKNKTNHVEGYFPAKANTFYLPETETIGDSVEDAIRQSVEFNGPLSPGEYEIDIYWWGDEIAYRFDVMPDGTPHFVKMGAIQ